MGFSGEIFIVTKYILQRSRKICYKPCIQQPIKLMVALSENNASVSEFNGIG